MLAATCLQLTRLVSLYVNIIQAPSLPSPPSLSLLFLAKLCHVSAAVYSRVALKRMCDLSLVLLGLGGCLDVMNHVGKKSLWDFPFPTQYKPDSSPTVWSLSLVQHISCSPLSFFRAKHGHVGAHMCKCTYSMHRKSFPWIMLASLEGCSRKDDTDRNSRYFCFGAAYSSICTYERECKSGKMVLLGMQNQEQNQPGKPNSLFQTMAQSTPPCLAAGVFSGGWGFFRCYAIDLGGSSLNAWQMLTSQGGKRRLQQKDTVPSYTLNIRQPVGPRVYGKLEN